MQVLNARTAPTLELVLQVFGIHYQDINRTAAAKEAFGWIKAKLIDADGHYGGFEAFVWEEKEDIRKEAGQKIMEQFKEGNV